MWKVRDYKAPKRKNRQYSPTSMTTAFMHVRETGNAIRTTARQYGVPESSLRHKLSGRVDPEATRSGPAPLFGLEEEARLVNHLKFTSSVGYGYSRSEVVDIGSEYAVRLGYRDKDHPLGLQWYSGFMSRWPELKVLKPRGLEMQRAKSTSLECVTNYYNELGLILTKYDLSDKPERIYNIDEKGLSTRHNAPPVVTARGTKPPAVTSGSRTNITVIGCGNALGNSVPPYFIFPGIRWNEDLLADKTPGADGSMSDSGWCNGDVFRKYMENHLLKYLPARDANNPVLILYDGHASHVSIILIDWAKTQHLILFVLPAHTSHVLQPMDIGCFGPYSRIFNKKSHAFMRKEGGRRCITKFDICSLGCSAYTKALSPDNIQASFRQAGIYPFNPNSVDPSNFKPAEVFVQEDTASPEVAAVPENPAPEEPHDPEPIDFFTEKEKPLREKKPPTKKRRCLSYISSGKAVTEDNTFEKIKEHVQSRKSKPKEKSPTKLNAVTKSSKKCKGAKSSKKGKGVEKSSKSSRDPASLLEPVPESAREPVLEASSSQSDIGESDDDEVCCVCGLFRPEEIQGCLSVIFTKWVKCDKPGCTHWSHLKYCTDIKVVRRGDIFYCCHCSSEE